MVSKLVHNLNNTGGVLPAGDYKIISWTKYQFFGITYKLGISIVCAMKKVDLIVVCIVETKHARHTHYRSECALHVVVSENLHL